MPERLWRCCLFLWLWLAGAALAAEIEVSNPQLLPTEEGYVLSANFAVDLNPRLEEAVTKGVVLHFVVDFELTRPRWYWLDQRVIERSQTYRLSYHALTRQYRVSTGGGLHQSYTGLSEALRALGHLRGWLVAERGERAPRAGESYQASLRMALDVSQLPRPFQISALGNRDWVLASELKPWVLTLPALPSQAAEGAR